MTQRSLEERVTILEQKVEALEKLPGEMRALRGELADFRTEFLLFRDEIRLAFSAVATRTELRELKAEMMAHTLALHEDLVEKIKVLGEHRNGGTTI